MSTLEERFWSHVWQCTHRRPCRQCCWPYGREADYYDPLTCYLRFHKHGMFLDKGTGRGTGAHRMAYMLVHGKTLIFPGTRFAVCHQCNYGYCCNPAHLSLGAQADNGRDRRGQRCGNDPGTFVLFPDGRRIVRVDPRLARPGALQRRATIPPDKPVTHPVLLSASRRLGKEVHKGRIGRELTRQALADLTGLSFEKLSAIERGDIDPRWSTVLKLAQALDLNLDVVACDTLREQQAVS